MSAILAYFSYARRMLFYAKRIRMRITINDSDLDEIIFEKDFHAAYDGLTDIVEQETQLFDNKIGYTDISEIWFDGVHTLRRRSQLNQEVCLVAKSDLSVFEMHFSLTGSAEVESLNSKFDYSFGPQQHNFFYSSNFEGKFRGGKQEKPNEVFEIHFTENYFNRFVDSESKTIDKFLKQIDKQEISNCLSPHHMPITAQMNLILSQINQCQRKGVLKRLYLESKILELFMLQIEQFESIQLTPTSEKLKKEDVEKIYYAKKLLEQNISEPYSLLELAHKVGLNDFKLKKGFKILFGTTVFGYLHEIRMQQSKRMLLEENKPVKEVAAYCGYQYVQHFTTAFKNKFGITPGKLVHS